MKVFNHVIKPLLTHSHYPPSKAEAVAKLSFCAPTASARTAHTPPVYPQTASYTQARNDPSTAAAAGSGHTNHITVNQLQNSSNSSVAIMKPF